MTPWFPLQGKPLRLAEGWAACAGGLGTIWSRRLRSGGRKRSPGGLGPGLSQPPGGGQEKRNWDVDGGGGCHGWQLKHLRREEDTDFQEGEREEGRRPKDTLLLILEVSQGGGGGGQDLFQGTVAGIVGLGVRMEVRPQTPGRWRGQHWAGCKRGCGRRNVVRKTDVWRHQLSAGAPAAAWKFTQGQSRRKNEGARRAEKTGHGAGGLADARWKRVSK